MSDDSMMILTGQALGPYLGYVPSASWLASDVVFLHCTVPFKICLLFRAGVADAGVELNRLSVPL